jgi:3D (Asp-Asp-Asp) domain-containing protein
VAVDSDVIALGQVLYLPAYQGLRAGRSKPHDGCFIAEDRGLRVRGRHIDIFTGSPRMTKLWNAAVPSNRGIDVMIGASRCAYLRKQ